MKDIIIDNIFWENLYDYDIYLDQGIIVFTNLGLKGNEEKIDKKYYYKMDKKAMELANNIVDKVNKIDV